jgi:hypothetical protein
MDTGSESSEIKIKPEQSLLVWKSPSRLFKKRDREYFVNIAAIVFLLVVILIFAQEYMFILAVLSIVFFVYVISTVPPEEVEHRITTLGVESSGRYYRWENLKEFWFEEQWGQTKLVINSETHGRITILLGSLGKENIKDIISGYIPYRDQPQKTWMDNASVWISKKIPLDKPS